MNPNTTQVCKHGINVQAKNKCEQCARDDIAKRLAIVLSRMMTKSKCV
jgi:hypothetical protein